MEFQGVRIEARRELIRTRWLDEVDVVAYVLRALRASVVHCLRGSHELVVERKTLSIHRRRLDRFSSYRRYVKYAFD